MLLFISENKSSLDILTHLHNATIYVHTPCPGFKMSKKKMFSPLTVHYC